jgi:glycosyltransferase involved in cell wall biosynthesis
MRVTYLQLTHMYAPSWGYGGPVRLMFDYARWLGRVFDVVVFSGDLHHDFTRFPDVRHKQDIVSVHRSRIYYPALAKRSIYLPSLSMIARALWSAWITTKPVIVHVAEFRGLVPLYALLLKLCFRNRVLLVHSAFGMLHYKRGRHRTFYDSLFMKTFLLNTQIRLTQNQHEFDTYKQIDRDYDLRDENKTVLLPLHVDGIPSQSHRFSGEKKLHHAVAELRKQYDVPENVPVFIFLGRLHAEKGIIRLIDAFEGFCSECISNAMLLIVGRDDGFQSHVEAHILEKGLQDRVRIVNNVYETRFDYYFLSDVFLGFPTMFEETMLASIEALACGTPIIVSREADVPFVEEEGAGRVIDFSVETAIQAMAAVFRESESFQCKTRTTVERHFGALAASENLIHVLQERLIAMRAGRVNIPSDMVRSESGVSVPTNE